MMFYDVNYILKDFNTSIIKKDPFSLIRLGDGGLKLIHSIIFNEDRQVKAIVEKEGIPDDKRFEILELWAFSVNISNYIDSCQYYFTGNFWPRVRKNRQQMQPETIKKIMEWRFLYKLAGFKNFNYCNPEINFLSCLDHLDMSLLDIMKHRKICCICSNPEKLNKVLNSYQVDYIEIVGNNDNHYTKCFNTVISNIKRTSKKYDIWLVAAGELGRIYSGFIKNKGGRVFDVGSLVDYWAEGTIPLRLKWFVEQSDKNPLKITLNKDSLRYREFI